MQESIIKRILKWFGIVTLLALIFSCVWSFIWFYNIDAPDAEKGSQQARPLIDAIQVYRQETGLFPTYLHQLAPKYISTVPRPDWRHEYEYSTCPNGKTFVLAFVPQGEALGDGWYVYCSRIEEWQNTDSMGWQYILYECSNDCDD